jgi:TolB-like protein
MTLALAAPAGAIRRVEKTAERLAEKLFASSAERGANIAVLPFESENGKASELGRAFADAVAARALQKDRFTVLDRQYVSRMLGEIRLGMTGLGDPKTAARIGKFSGARYLLVGRVESVSKKKIRVSARLLETETSKLIASASEESRLNAEMRSLLAKTVPLDAAAASLFGARERSSGAVFLDRPGVRGCRWIESRASVPLADSADASRAAALSVARSKAVSRLLGSEPKGLPDFGDGAVTDNLEKVLRATRSSRVEAEKIVDAGKASGRYELTLETCLKPARTGGGLSVEMMLNQNRFSPGQDARAIVTASRDARLYLFSVDFDGRAILVFPAEGARDNRIRAGSPFAYPDEKHREAGIRLVAELPAGHARSVETLRALVAERDVAPLFAGLERYADIVAAVEDSGAAWDEDARVFTIRAR